MNLRIFVLVLAGTVLISPVWGQVVDGVDQGAGAQNLLPNGDDYDPPTVFLDTLSLDSSWNGNRAARAYYALGNGTVLQPDSLGVTGFSVPNSVVWNCGASTANGATPALPQLIAYTGSGGTVTRVSMTVGSATSAGLTATLFALNSGFGVLDVDSVTIAAAMQPLSTTSSGTSFSWLVGPCVLVMDDLRFD